MTSSASASAALAALLRGDANAFAALKAVPPEMLLDTARREGLVPLAADQWPEQPAAGPVGQWLAREAREALLLDIVRQQELDRLLLAFEVAPLKVLIFKGEQLARTCYARPDLRPRLDTDLLVRPADRDRAREILEAAGYVPVPQLEADLISYQHTFVRRLGPEASLVIDLHWRVCNPQEFGGALEVEELFAKAAPIPGLPGAAAGPGPVHALLLSLLHPIAHHHGRERLLWDLDTSRLAALMSGADWVAFVDMAGERRLSALCHVRLQRAVEVFRAPVPAAVMTALADKGTAKERARIGSIRRTTQARSIWADARAISGWRDRLAFVRQHLLPSADYMRRVYAPSSRSPLGVLYVQRAMFGAWKYLRRPH